MIERAHRSDDPQLVGFALYCKAMLHTDMADGASVLDLTGAGLRDDHRLIPKVRALLLQQAARRDIGVYHARYAQALAGLGEPEQAVNVARLAVPVAAQSGSARMRALHQRMEPWRGGQPWRDLEDTLRALPRAGKAG
jgi:hypothetical protein